MEDAKAYCDIVDRFAREIHEVCGEVTGASTALARSVYETLRLFHEYGCTIRMMQEGRSEKAELAELARLKAKYEGVG